MTTRTVPETIDQDWERFYTEFPDIYDRFAVTSPVVATKIDKLFGVRGKIVVDVGSGTGRSTFALADKARLVIGVDPWPAMRQFAVAKARQARVRNVAFLEGVAQRLPLRDRSVDLIVAVLGVPLVFRDSDTGDRLIADLFVPDALRALRPGGYVVSVEGAPGPPDPAVGRRSTVSMAQQVHDVLAGRHGFQYRDIYVEQEYSSLREAIETFGFIYGKDAIGYLRRTGRTRYRNRMRIHYKQSAAL